MIEERKSDEGPLQRAWYVLKGVMSFTAQLREVPRDAMAAKHE